jgi:hypothetical protein
MLGVDGGIIDGQYFKDGSRLMWRIAYWLLTGALLGVGFIAILSIGSLFVLLGVLLVVLGALRVGPRGIWAALVGFGAVPAAILIWAVTSMPGACEGRDALPNVNYFSCVDTPLGPLTTYHVMALFFGVIVLAGLVWPLARMVWTRTSSRAAYPSN